jgi:hypothetical protein
MQGTQLKKPIAGITGGTHRSRHYFGICAHPSSRQKYPCRQLSMPVLMQPAQGLTQHFTRTRKNTAHRIMKGFPRNPIHALRFLSAPLMGSQGRGAVALTQANAASDSPKVQSHNCWRMLYDTGTTKKIGSRIQSAASQIHARLSHRYIDSQMRQTLLAKQVFASPNELLCQIRSASLKLHTRQMVTNLYL